MFGVRKIYTKSNTLADKTEIQIWQALLYIYFNIQLKIYQTSFCHDTKAYKHW